MTVTTAFTYYNEGEYNEDEYLTGLGQASMGWQVQLVVESQDALGTQVELVAHADRAYGWQAQYNIEDSALAVAWQVELNIVAKELAKGVEFNGVIAFLASRGWQFEAQNPNGLRAIANEFKADTLAHTLGGQLYNEGEYNEGPYNSYGMLAHLAWQFDAQKATAIAFQFNAVLYNTKQLRVLLDFKSRGNPVASVSLNAWGQAIGNGRNWRASSTKASATNSFSPDNLNTDIVEQRWQSADGITTGIELDCDAEIAQGIFLDTLAILGGNLTTSAVVTLIGSLFDDFSVVGVSIGLVSDGEGTITYMAPDVPISGYRYWRLNIDDVTNPDGHIKIGTIVFGDAIVFSGCFVDRVQYDPTNFTDEISTEAFTAVQNDRGIKNAMRLEFRNLKYLEGDFQRLKSIFNTARTVLKALWVPTPEFAKRYLLFGKLKRLPSETHNVKSETNDLVSLTVELDEAR